MGVATKFLNRTKSNQDTVTHLNQKSKTIDKEQTPCRKEVMQLFDTKDFVLQILRHLHSEHSNLSAVKIICLFICFLLVNIICAKNSWKIENVVSYTSQPKLLLFHCLKSQNGVYSYQSNVVKRNLFHFAN